MSEEDRYAAEQATESALREFALQVQALDGEQQAEFNKRIKDLEGTASDLKAVPLVGPVILLLRGAFRPLFSYATAYWDFLYFTGSVTLDDEGQTLLYLVNALVLSFYFGERALKNLLPIIIRWLEVRGFVRSDTSQGK
jgi:hypothetical protein